MYPVSPRSNTAASKNPIRRLIAGVAAATLIAGTLVAVGIGAQMASAAGPAPTVEATTTGTFLAGEDLTVDLVFTSGDGADDQYNLSAGIVLPEHVTVVDTGTLGVPQVFPVSETDRVIPGVYSQFEGECAALGLKDAPGASNACQVPVGKQYLVFQNISDLPDGASTSHALTLRPEADSFPVGSKDLDLQVTAYTSDDERFIPVFPGTRSVAGGNDHTSEPGGSNLQVPVNALRIEKSEPSPESELLRGVHENTTTYTLSVYHTGEGNIENTSVVDFIPAGLEYLGLGGTDNTTNANGTQGATEYPDAASLDETPVPDPTAGTWQNAGESVETVQASAEDAEKYGLVEGAVYTKVTWNLGTLLANTDPRGTDGVQQDYAGTAGEPGLIQIRYRAGIPLYENTMEFIGADGAYDPDTTGKQASNLDNNTGRSTRHGTEDSNAWRDTDGAAANSYTNVAIASGEYLYPDETRVVTDDSDSETIDAVDVRILKSVSSESFTQGEVVRYTLDLAASEYMNVTVRGPNDRPYRLVDDMADGLCPVFPSDTPIAEGASQHAGLPNLTLGNPAEGDAKRNNSADDWNAALSDAGVSAACTWGSNAGDEADVLEGAELIGIAFDPATARFYLDFALLPTNALATGEKTHGITYSVRQNEAYLVGNGEQGATSSGDWLSNEAEILALTTPINEITNVGTPGMTEEEQGRLDAPWNAWDDSEVVVQAELTDLDKKVLQRSAGVPGNNQIWETESNGGPAEGDWVDHADAPFAIGDEVWYRVQITPPPGADVRNPKFTDFLPAGVEFDQVDADEDDRFDNIVVKSKALSGLGSCDPENEGDWLDEFVPDPDLNGNVLTWNLGSTDCVAGDKSTDRFLPLNNQLEIYIKVTVTDISAFGTVDLAENLAKYQQENVDGEIFFLRDDAGIDLAQQIRLLKGIHDIDGDAVERDGRTGDRFNSDIDSEEVVQGDEVTFRLDVTTPQVESTDYVIWDALPLGVKKADIKGADPATGGIPAGEATAATVTAGDPATVTPLNEEEWTATVYDFGDDGYPADLREDPYANVERSVIVWTVNGTVPGSVSAVPATETDPAVESIDQGLTLGYTVVVPSGVTGGGAAALLDQKYVNDASIVSYGSVSNSDNVVDIVPEGDNTLSTAGPGDGQYGISDEGTFDPSDVFLPGAEMDKMLVSTEIPSTSPDVTDPQNPENVIVQGEYATFNYSVTVPANTTVHEGELFDLGDFVGQSGNGTIEPGNSFAYKVDSARMVTTPSGISVNSVSGDLKPDPSTDSMTFQFMEDYGKLIFPEFYSTGDEDRTFVAEVVVWTADVDASNTDPSADRPNIPNNKVLRNTAVFDSKAVDGEQNTRLEDPADVTYREPNLLIAKSASPSEAVTSKTEITYTLDITNTNRVKSYENTVVDTVPAGVLVRTAPLAAAGATFSPDAAALETGLGGTIAWSYEDFDTLEEIPDTATLSYTATIDPTTGAAQNYVNTAEVAGYTLPSTLPDAENRRGDRADSDRATVTATTADITKDVRVFESGDDFANGASAPIGDIVEYQIEVLLHADINYYNARIIDSFSGADIGTPERVEITGPTADPEDSVPGTWMYDPGTGEWTIDNGGSPHIASVSDDRTLTITYQVKLENDMTANSLPNTAQFQWTTLPGGDIANPDDRGEVEDDATVTVLNPVLNLEKKVDAEDSITRNPDKSFEYALTVTNTGNTPAHNIDITDAVPEGVIVTDPISNGGVLSGADSETGGGTITWTGLGPISDAAGSNSLTLTYQAEFAASGHLSADAYVNEAEVTEYESFEDDGRVYVPGTGGVPPAEDDASVTPIFPNVVPKKTVTAPVAGKQYGVAIAGEPFGWTLTITNDGPGIARSISVTDELPLNWTYDEDSAQINGEALNDPKVIVDLTDSTGETVTWTADQLGSVTPLAADGSFVITFTATPSTEALTTPGTGVGDTAHVHQNTLSVTATDTQGNDENGDGDYVEEDSTADAYMAEADLHLEKAAIGGDVDTGATETNLYGLDAGTWVPGQGVKTDAPAYDQPQWQITVTNQGPDASEGPFVFKDETVEPDGVDTGSWSARYYSSESDKEGTLLTLAPTSKGFTVSGDNLSLKADGSDRIVVTADVTIAPGATAAGSELHNIADVRGHTYENPENFKDNEDDAEKTLSVIADLAIEKSFAKIEEGHNAGDPISWTMTVLNNGPSDSISSIEAPITVTDEVPAEIENVQQLVGSTLPAGWALQLEGNRITLTLTPDAVFPATGAGSRVEFYFTGNVKASVDDGTEIVNSATVTPGETPDPDPENNEDDTTTEPITTDTTVEANKYRVEHVDGEWAAVGEEQDVTAGTTYSYLLSITNIGNADARGVSLNDVLPSTLDFVEWEAVAPANGWELEEVDKDLTFTNDQKLVPGATASVVVTVKVNESATGDIVNEVCVDADNSTVDPDDPIRCASDSTGTDKMVDWELEKSHTIPESGAVAAGETVRYLLQVHNNGPSASAGPITVTDVLPAGFTYADGLAVTGGTVTGTETDKTDDGLDRVVWTIAGGPFATGDDVVTIEFDAKVTANVDADVYTNSARVDGVALEPDSDPNNNDDTDDVPVVRTADMHIVKEVKDSGGNWVESTLRAAGTDATWRVAITNKGPSAVPVTFTDELPAGLTMTSMDGEGWDCDLPGGTLPMCEYDTNGGLHPVGTTYIEFTSDIAASVPPTESGATGLVNWGQIDWVDDTTEEPTDRDDAEITIYRAADLGIEKTALDADGDETTSVIAGESLWYSLDVWNDGPSDAVAPLVVHDTLPDGISFVGLTGTSAANWSASVDSGNTQLVTFTRTPAAGILHDQRAPEIRFEVAVDETVTAGHDLDNVAAIDKETLDTNGDPTDDPDEAPDSDNVLVTAERLVDLGIEKSHDAGAVRVGDELPFTLQVTNHGPSQATGVTVTDTVPAGLAVVSELGPVLDASGEPSGWTVESIVLVDAENPAGGATVVATYADPLSSEERAAPLVLITLVTPEAYDSVVNVAEVSGEEPEPDPDPNPNRDEDPVTVPPLVTLVVEKTAVGDFQVGKTGTFEIEVQNLGPTADPGPITVTDTLPRGLSFHSTPNDGAEVRGQTVTWVLEEGLAVGESASFTLVVNVGLGAYPEVTNVVTVDSAAEKTPESILSDDATVTVAAADPLAITGADFAALWILLALLLALAGAALLLRRQRERTAAMIEA